jgi:hypothetical protein
MQSATKQKMRAAGAGWALTAISQATLRLGPRRLLTRPSMGLVADLLRTGLPIILLLFAACSSKAPGEFDRTRRESQTKQEDKRPPIAPEVVREKVEQQENFKQVRKAACPRRIPDRIERRAPFPAIDVLHGLQYVTITDDSSRGIYEKVIELTGPGRLDLARHLEEQTERYIITIGQREYLPGSETFDYPYGRDDRLFVSFRWQWKALNPLGERLTLWIPYSGRTYLHGRATYARTANGWKFEDVWLESSGADYVGGLYK